MQMGSSLADQNVAGLCQLAVMQLCAKALRCGITAVLRAGNALLMSE